MAGNWVARWPCQASPPGVLLRQWLPSGRWKWLVVIVVVIIIIIIIIIIIPSINGLVRSKIYRKHCLYFVPATYFSLSQFWEGRDGEIKMLEIRSYWSCIKRLNTSADMLLRGEIPVTFASWTWAFTGYLPNLSSSVINWAIPIFLLLNPMITHVTGYQPTPSDVSRAFGPTCVAPCNWPLPFFGKSTEKSSCRFSSQKRFDTSVELFSYWGPN